MHIKIIGMLLLLALVAALGQPVPLLASFKLTYHCNLACRACPFHHRAADRTGISAGIRHAAYDGLRAELPHDCFEGGEPLLWRGDGGRRVHDLLDYAKKLFLRVAVGDQQARFISTCRLMSVWVSIDGLPPTLSSLRSFSFARIRNLSCGHIIARFSSTILSTE